MNVPKHMEWHLEFYGHFSPEYYREDTCANCGEPIYRYQMDTEVKWRHFNHASYCSTLTAKPLSQVTDPRYAASGDGLLFKCYQEGCFCTDNPNYREWNTSASS